MRSLQTNHAGRSNPPVGSRLLLSLLLLAVLRAQGSEATGTSMNRARDVVTRKERRRIKKKSPKHFSLDALVDGFDGDDTYFSSYHGKKKSSKKSEKKKCKGKGGKSSSSKKKKDAEESSSGDDSDDDDDFDECTASPTVLITESPTITPTIAPTEAPTISPTLQPTTLSPTVQPTVSRTDAPTTSAEDSKSSEKSKKSKKEKSSSEKGKKSKDEKSEVRVSPSDTSKDTTSTVDVKADTVKTKASPKFRAEIPIAVPFPSTAPLQSPTTAFPSNLQSFPPTSIPSTAPSRQPATASTVGPIQSSSIRAPSPTNAPSVAQSKLPTTGPSISPVKSEKRSYTRMEPAIENVKTQSVASSTTLVEASAFYVTFLLSATALDPTNADMKQAIVVCTTFLENYVEATFSLVDASDFVKIMSAPFSFSPDFTSIELLTAMEFEDSSEFIPSTEDIDMLLEIAFSEPSVGTLLELLAELPYENSFRQTRSVTRTAGSLQLQLSSSRPPPSLDPSKSKSTSSKRGSLVGACAAAFVVVAFAAVYRNRSQIRRRRKGDHRSIDYPDFTAEANESSIGAPTLMEQLVGDNEINTIEFYGDDDEPPYLDEKSSHQGGLFESPFLQGEIPRKFNEV